MKTRILYLYILISVYKKSDSINPKETYKHSWQYITLKRIFDGYVKQEPPPPSERPTDVFIGINVNSFYSISEQSMDYSVILYLRQQWLEPRLKFPSPDGILHQMKLPDDYGKELWVPDIFFRNEKHASYHDVTVPNRLLRINSNGSVWYTIKISATLSCPMNLESYPLDIQRCPMMFESFGYTKDTMDLKWLDNAVDIDKDLELPQFKLLEEIQTDCSQNYTAGSFPCLSITFVLRRDIGFFIIQVYVPSMLIVILSWVSFWINIDASPARVSLGLLTVLTTTTMSGGARESLPRVSYIKAIDVWMIMCLLFVFASLIEYAIVNVVARRQIKAKPVKEERMRHRGLTNNLQLLSGESPNLTGLIRRYLKVKSTREDEGDRSETYLKTYDQELSKRRARTIDKISRKFFPLAFLVFNIIYWLIYATGVKSTDEPAT